MKKLFLTTAFAMAMVLGNAAIAQTAAPTGGFKGPGIQPTTVKQALELKDDTPVTVTGTIVRSLGNEKYEFTDGTGTITVEIDDEDWRGTDVTPADTVTLTGEVDKGLIEKTEIDVDRVEKK